MIINNPIIFVESTYLVDFLISKKKILIVILITYVAFHVSLIFIVIMFPVNYVKSITRRGRNYINMEVPYDDY